MVGVDGERALGQIWTPRATAACTAGDVVRGIHSGKIKALLARVGAVRAEEQRLSKSVYTM